MHYFRLLACFLLCLFLSSCSPVQHIGLRAGSFFDTHLSCSAAWIPYGLKDSIDDFALVSKCIPYSEDQEIFMRNALERLLLGPDEEDSKRGFTSLVRKARLVDLRIKHGTAVVTFSREFQPAGGSTATWHARTAVHELLRQFPGIKKVRIRIEGVSEEEVLQP